MSALSLGSTDGVERVIHRFSQKQALPSYLFAIAVGDIIKGDLGYVFFAVVLLSLEY